jgi:dUTP pyrophosphatase
MIELKVKKLHTEAVIPTYAKQGDAGMDLVAVSKTIDPVHNQLIFGFGLAFEIPLGYVGLVFPRSSIYKTGLSLTNCVGVIDAGYRGEVKARFRIEEPGSQTYMPGDKIAQLVIMQLPNVFIKEVDELSDSERGAGGFGSSGR